MLNILNKLTLQKELQTFETNSVFLTKCKNTTITKQKNQTYNPCQSRELNPAPLAPKADTLPLYHRVI